MKFVTGCLVLLNLLPLSVAFPVGAGQCTRNTAAPAPHGGQDTPLADGGYTVTVAGTQVLPGAGAATVTAGEPFDIVVSGPDFRGFLITLPDEPEGDLVGPDGISKQADGANCAGIAAITHTSNDIKSDGVTVTGTVVDPKTTQIEMNIVVQNSGGVSIYHYDWIDLEVIPATAVTVTDEPTAGSTTIAPTIQDDPTILPSTIAPTTGDSEPGSTVDPTTQAPTGPDLPLILELAYDTPDLSTLASLLPDSLVEALSESGTYTVFAPINSAFDALPDNLADSWQAEDDAVSDVIRYHVLDTVVLSSALQEGAVVTTLNGADLTVTSLDPVTINDAVVVTADIMASNGVVHLIDKVLLPPSAATETPTAPGGDIVMTEAPMDPPPMDDMMTDAPMPAPADPTPAPTPVSTEQDTSTAALVVPTMMMASLVAMIMTTLVL